MLICKYATKQSFSIIKLAHQQYDMQVKRSLKAKSLDVLNYLDNYRFHIKDKLENGYQNFVSEYQYLTIM